MVPHFRTVSMTALDLDYFLKVLAWLNYGFSGSVLSWGFFEEDSRSGFREISGGSLFGKEYNYGHFVNV